MPIGIVSSKTTLSSLLPLSEAEAIKGAFKQRKLLCVSESTRLKHVMDVAGMVEDKKHAQSWETGLHVVATSTTLLQS
eukprot:2463234-Amphidinium_carterae.1